MISVLYVDDEQGFLEIAQLFLEQSGDFSVKTVTSAQEALDSPAIRSCDAIVSDYHMQGMDGITFLKAVRERFGDIPFVLFTGRGREEVVIEAINNGADFYLQKGGDPEAQFAELAHKIRQAVRTRQAERSLHDSERRLSDIIDFLPDATFAIDQSGHVIAWNRAIEEMTGIPARDMLGKGNIEYAVPFYGSRRRILIDMVIEPDKKNEAFYPHIYRIGNSITAETDLPNPKGHRISALGKATLLYNQAGEITGAIESIRDITELKKNEMELRAAYQQVTATEEELRLQYDDLLKANEQLTAAKQELRRQFDLLAESEQMLRVNEERLVMAQSIGHAGSWEYHIPANRIWGSANALRIFGYPAVAGDFPIADIEACIPERERVHQVLVDLLTTGQEYDLEFEINPADGSAPKVIHSIARLEKDTGGHPVRVIGVIQDITERRKADDALRRANRQLSLLTGITRHDLHNKITVILGYLKIAKKKCTDPGQAGYLEKIESTITAIRSQIEFTRIYQDLGTRDPQWIDLETVMPRSQVPATISLTADTGGVTVFADPMFEKVFTNLLDNSIRHGKQVTGISVSSRRDGDALVVVWEDNGVGVAGDEKEQIFERGFGKHTGLGLFLVREILALSGITIRETGEPGRGARFEIRVPDGEYRIAAKTQWHLIHENFPS
ncbi:PAS domain S-box protein [Methanoregula sp.]|uniref:PAS domain S-box protein n=1 Tax=Methanoregula sp. TaxID=2052170 RepID=UPI003BB00DC5